MEITTINDQVIDQLNEKIEDCDIKTMYLDVYQPVRWKKNPNAYETYSWPTTSGELKFENDTITIGGKLHLRRCDIFDFESHGHMIYIHVSLGEGETVAYAFDRSAIERWEIIFDDDNTAKITSPDVVVKDNPFSHPDPFASDCNPFAMESEKVITKEEPTKSTSSEENTMSNSRSVVKVSIIDPSIGIEPEDALIASLGDHVVDGSYETLKLKLAMNPETKLAEKLEAHNKKRAEIIDLDIRARTGAEVNLQPLKIEEVKWEFK